MHPIGPVLFLVHGSSFEGQDTFSFPRTHARDRPFSETSPSGSFRPDPGLSENGSGPPKKTNLEFFTEKAKVLLVGSFLPEVGQYIDTALRPLLPPAA